MIDLALSHDAQSSQGWFTKGKLWFQALGLRDELRALRISSPALLPAVVAPAVALPCLYGLAGAILNGRLGTYLPFGRFRYVTADEPVLYLATIVSMGLTVIAALFLFFRDDGA